MKRQCTLYIKLWSITMIIGVTTEKSHSDYNFHRVRCLFYTMVTLIITATIELQPPLTILKHIDFHGMTSDESATSPSTTVSEFGVEPKQCASILRLIFKERFYCISYYTAIIASCRLPVNSFVRFNNTRIG